MKRYIVIGEIVLILLLTGLILLDFTGVGRENRKQYKEIDHISGDATPEVVSVAPLEGKDPYVYHVEGDKLVGPTPTSTPTPTPTPTLSPAEVYPGRHRAGLCLHDSRKHRICRSQGLPEHTAGTGRRRAETRHHEPR